MKVTTERQENCVMKLDISVEPEEENAYLRRSARTLSREYRIRGFRPGKAPYNVVVQRLGMEMVRAQVVEQFGDQIFEEGLAKSELEPVDQASLQDVTWEPLTLHLTWQIFKRQFFSFCQYNALLNDMYELPDVAGPFVR